MPSMVQRASRTRRRARRVRVKTPPVLFEKTQALFGRIQKQVDGTFLTLLDVHGRIGLRQRRDGAARDPRAVRTEAGRRAARQVGRGQRHDLAAARAPAAALREAPHGDRPAQLRLGRHHAGARRRHHPDGAALLPHRRRHLARARPLAARPRERARPGEQRRGRPRDPPLEGDGRAARRHRQPVPGALQVPAPAGDRRARPCQQPVADALPRDPRLSHEGPAQGRSHRAPAQLLLSRAPVPDHEPRGTPARPQGPGDTGAARRLCSRS